MSLFSEVLSDTSQLAFKTDQILLGIDLVINALSCGSCLFLLLAYSRVNESTSAQFKMAVNLAVSDLFLSFNGFLTYLVGRGDSFYEINSILGIVAIWSTAFWAVAIAALQYKKIARSRGFDSMYFYQQMLKLWFIVCLVVPITFSVIAFHNGVDYTLSDYRYDKGSSSSQFVTLFIFIEVIPFGSSIIISWISYLKQISILKELSLFDMADLDLKKILKYPIGLSLILLPSLIFKSWYIISQYEFIALNAIRLFGYYFAGFINFFVYRMQVHNVGSSVNGSLIESKIFPQAFNSRRPTTAEEPEHKISESDLEDL